jgi:hypothetical protein
MERFKSKYSVLVTAMSCLSIHVLHYKRHRKTCSSDLLTPHILVQYSLHLQVCIAIIGYVACRGSLSNSSLAEACHVAKNSRQEGWLICATRTGFRDFSSESCSLVQAGSPFYMLGFLNTRMSSLCYVAKDNFTLELFFFNENSTSISSDVEINWKNKNLLLISVNVGNNKARIPGFLPIVTQ